MKAEGLRGARCSWGTQELGWTKVLPVGYNAGRARARIPGGRFKFRLAWAGTYTGNSSAVRTRCVNRLLLRQGKSHLQANLGIRRSYNAHVRRTLARIRVRSSQTSAGREYPPPSITTNTEGAADMASVAPPPRGARRKRSPVEGKTANGANRITQERIL